MKNSTKTLEFSFERAIPAAPVEVFDAWMNPRVPGTPWNSADQLILDLKTDGLFYWRKPGELHYGYGRFIEIERPHRIKHTWVSPHDSMGEESIVTVEFKKQGENTLMTLVHSNLPSTDGGRAVEKGWKLLLDIFSRHFAAALVNMD